MTKRKENMGAEEEGITKNTEENQQKEEEA